VIFSNPQTHKWEPYSHLPNQKSCLEDVRTPKKLMLEDNRFALQYNALCKFDKSNSAVRLLQVSCRTVFAATPVGCNDMLIQ